ncbi:FAD-dependent oxidoreductase [Candidatus Woesearchaeota archaeon]|nr:FAD-dependent oxidoreductase [Candidatus Woesearchaeota archaeon]
MYDIIIIGGGAAGLTAGIYSQRYNLRTVIVTEHVGGLALNAYNICNFPSYQNVPGIELMKKIEEHARNEGVEFFMGRVEQIKKEKDKFIIITPEKSLEAKKIILAIGTKQRRLNFENGDKFLGRGISYCATCDASLFRNKEVGVVGGGNSALTSALLLSEYAEKVYIIHRKKEFSRADPAWVKQVNENKKIECIFETEVSKIMGKEFLESAELSNGKILKIDGLFVEAGSIPNKEVLNQTGIKTNENGYIITDDEQRTNIEGIYAAGDITNNKLKQIITACAGGAIAAYQAYKDISKERS